MKYSREENLTLVICARLDVNALLNNGKENLGKFDPKADEGIFLGYSLSSKAYIEYIIKGYKLLKNRFM